jgi:hypothetical protein
MVATFIRLAVTLCPMFLFFRATPAVANFPVVRFKNETVGILADKSGDVFIRGKGVFMHGTLLISKNGNIQNVTDAMINLRAKERDLSARVSRLGQSRNFTTICNPFNTEYLEKNITSGEFGECVCKEGYSGERCESNASIST